MNISVSLCLIHLHSTVKLHEFLKQPSEQRALCQLLAPSIPLLFSGIFLSGVVVLRGVLKAHSLLTNYYKASNGNSFTANRSHSCYCCYQLVVC